MKVAVSEGCVSVVCVRAGPFTYAPQLFLTTSLGIGYYHLCVDEEAEILRGVEALE